MLLSILIPTYNRSKYLLQNLESLKVFATNTDEEIEIVISNNCSPDDTHTVVSNLIETTPQVNFRYFLQSENVGLEKNALITLEKATGEYVMYLGDDDYLEDDYLVEVLRAIKTNKSISCIIPSFIAIDVDKKDLGFGRDLNMPNGYFKVGFDNCLTNSWRGHQLSGLLLKKEGLHEAYLRDKVRNLYPFIYFTSYSCLKGDTMHITGFPVKVTQPPQESKDWNYGKDGLISDVFDNYKKLKGISLLERSELEFKFLKVQKSRYRLYKERGRTAFLSAIIRIAFGKNTSIFTTFKFLFFIAKLFFLKLLNILKIN